MMVNLPLVVSDKLPTNKRIFVVAHELGHVLLHKEFCTIFMRENKKGIRIPYIEGEANEFAFYLILYELNSNEIFYNKLDIVRSLDMPDDMTRFIKSQNKMAPSN